MLQIQLVALSDEHVAAVCAACRNWRELAAFGSPYWRPRSAAELRRKAAAMSGPQVASEYIFVIAAVDPALPEGEWLVGECSIHGIDWRNRLAQVGICIWDPKDRGRGYGGAAVREVVGWVVGFLSLRRIEAWVVEGNAASLALFTGLGFVEEGLLRDRYLVSGRRKGMHVLAWTGDRLR